MDWFWFPDTPCLEPCLEGSLSSAARDRCLQSLNWEFMGAPFQPIVWTLGSVDPIRAKRIIISWNQTLRNGTSLTSGSQAPSVLLGNPPSLRFARANLGPRPCHVRQGKNNAFEIWGHGVDGQNHHVSVCVPFLFPYISIFFLGRRYAA